MADVKQILKETIEKHRKAKADEDSVRQQKNDSDRNKILENISSDLASSLAPILAELPKAAQISEETIKNALSEAIQVNMPEMDTEGLGNAVRESIAEAFAGLKIPTPKVSVQAPVVKLPEIKIPETKYPERMNVGLEDYNAKNPLVVRLVDTSGKPFSFSVPISSGGGGKTDFFTVKGIQNTIGIVSINPDGTPAGAGSVASSVSVSDIFSTVGADVINPDGRIKVELPTGASGLTDTELRASHLDVQQLSGAIDSVYVTGVAASVYAEILNPDGRVKVELPSGSTGLTDTELRAAHLDVQQVSGTTDSVNVVSTVGLTDTELRAASLDVRQVSGASNSVNVLAGTITTVTTVTNITNSVATVGNVASDVADNGDGPVKIGGIARTANPTAVSGGDRVSFTSDDLGRQIVRPVQVRDLTLTAYTSVANGTETTLRAAVAGANLDMIMLMLANNSDAAVTVDVRSVTAGNIEMSVVVPPYGTAGYSGSVPWPQSATGNNWTIDMPDITGTTVYASAEFSQEV